MTDEFPTFICHPDPIGTDSVKQADSVCVCCGKARGFIYIGPVFAQEELAESLCPWCIADGSANERFGAEFTDAGGIGDYGTWDAVPSSVIEEISRRTPGFSGWQQERWFTCCGDGAQFLGRAGHKEIEELGNDAVEAIRNECGLDGDDWNSYFAALDRDGSPTAYIFRCRRCSRVGGYSDCD